MTSGQLGLLTSLTALKLPWISHLFCPRGFFFLCLFPLTLHKSSFYSPSCTKPASQRCRAGAMWGHARFRNMPMACPVARSPQAPQAVVISCILSKIWLDDRCWKKPGFYRRQCWEPVSFVCTRPLNVTLIGLVLMLPCGMGNQLKNQWFCSNVAHFHGIYCELSIISSSFFNAGVPRRTRCHKKFCCVQKSIPVFHSCSEKLEHLTQVRPEDSEARKQKRALIYKSILFDKPIWWVIKCLT